MLLDFSIGIFSYFMNQINVTNLSQLQLHRISQPFWRKKPNLATVAFATAQTRILSLERSGDGPTHGNRFDFMAMVGICWLFYFLLCLTCRNMLHKKILYYFHVENTMTCSTLNSYQFNIGTCASVTRPVFFIKGYFWPSVFTPLNLWNYFVTGYFWGPRWMGH